MKRSRRPDDGDRPVETRILEMCRAPLSIAEMSAYPDVPVAVVLERLEAKVAQPAEAS